MTNMVIQGQVQTGQGTLDIGISDLMILQQNGQSVLYTSTGQLGGLSAFSMSTTGTTTLIDTQVFNPAWADGTLRDLSLVEVGGMARIAVAASGDDQLRLYEVNANGSIGTEVVMSGIATNTNNMIDVTQSGSETLYMAEANTGVISAYTVGAGSTMVQTMSVSDTEVTYAADVMAIGEATVAGSSYMITASQTESGVSVFCTDDGSMVNTGNAGVNEGIGIMSPTGMEVVTMGGRSFVILASAPTDGIGQSGALTVLELAQDGSLVKTDHLIDTAATRFGQVQTLEVVEADGRTYVMAGGGDDGVTLFMLMPNGRLQMMSTISGDAGLNNVSAMAANFENGQLNMFVASETSAGVTQITADASNHGLVVEGSHSGGDVIGGAADDILIGGAQNDYIRGGKGADIMMDGLGIDTMKGAAGADIFVLSADYHHDVIADFEAGLDRLDLSSWNFFYDASQIGYTATANGATLDWRGETLDLISRDGQMLTFAEVQAGIMDAPSRSPDFSNFGGNDGAQLIDGTAINDAYVVGNGNDTVSGFAGDDYIAGGFGNDVLDGGMGQDTILAGHGGDMILGGDDADWIEGGWGKDTIEAGSGNDTIYGDEGVDRIRAGLGDDLIRGGHERDIILGDNGNDTLYGDGGHDVLRGGNGNDIILGGAGHDRLFGARHADTIYGGGANDLIRGGQQSDTCYGEVGDDTIYGGSGFDTLDGGEGDDLLTGDFNADIFVFADGHGNDTVTDFDTNLKPEKFDFSEMSMLNTGGDVRAASTQIGDDVLIDTGAGNSILVLNTVVADFDGLDFIF